ncbi:MAG: ammonium transporter, partial [Planctomycetota bacterium]
MRKFSYISILMFAFIVVLSQTGWADDATLDTGDNAWILTCSALVLLMTPGLAFFYGGMSSVKNINNMIMMVFLCMAIISVQWVFWGYSLSFGDDKGQFIGGLNFVGLHGITPDALSGTLSHYTFVAFQATFAIITVGLILGAVEGRMKFGACMLFIPLWATA